MLEPDDRQTLLDAFRIPSGMHLDAAVGTTFTLDLETLLSAPLAFAVADASAEADSADGAPATQLEPVALLEALRSYADRLTVFCQAGQIKLPGPRRTAFAWLEDCVIQAAAPRPGGIFHPKLWVLRFVAGADGPALLRVLCSSRNLTFDRSWDTLLRLETWANHSGPANGGAIADFVEGLSRAALNDPSEVHKARLSTIAADLRHADFQPPDGFDGIRWWPMGLAADGLALDLKGPHRAALVVSPFISTETLATIGAGTRRFAVVSRAESFSAVAADALPAADLYTLSPDLDPEEPAEPDTPDLGCLSGLHAKLFVIEQQGQTRLLTGSANATEAAFGSNVEFMCELTAPRRVLSVEGMLGTHEHQSSFRQLIAPYTPPSEPEPPDAREIIQRRVDRLAADMVRRGVTATVVEGPVGWRLHVAASAVPAASVDDLDLRCWPTTLPGAVHAKPVAVGEAISLDFPITIEAITSFIAFDVGSAQMTGSDRIAFVVNATLEGVPENRHERVLASMLRDPDRFIRYLFLLLGLDTTGDAGLMPSSGEGGDSTWRAGADTPLLEVMLRALARSPERLHHVRRLVADLQRSSDASLPEGFLEMWEPIDRALGRP